MNRLIASSPLLLALALAACGKSEAPTDTPRSLGEYIKTTAINTLPPVAAYYALRAFDVVPYLALVGAI
ncbi:MAG TPA: hypothetical protein PLN91_06575, partial [Rhodanobacteraceae bacterium]|nr:hypothetical protein [Rhodanobacteraceae bacterium]